MTKLVTEINSVYWQPKKGEIGEIAEGLDDIEQCINNVLQTPKGSVPHNPEFGNNAWKYIDAPMDVAIPNIIRETIDAITIWEQRVELKSVTPVAVNEQLTLTISWKLKNTEIERTQEVIMR